MDILAQDPVIDYANGVVDNGTITIAAAVTDTQLQVNTGTAEQAGVISETSANTPVEKIGGGTLILSAANTYTGTTTVTAGTLQLNGGSIAGAIINNSTFNVGATSSTAGTFGNNAGANFNVNAGTYTLTGLLTNDGNATVAAGAILMANGGITNDATGVFINNGTVFDDLNNAGAYTNNGTENANVATNTGTIDNNGTWNGNVVTNNNIINNNATGIWNGDVNSNAGTITNLGTWTTQTATGFNNDTGTLNQNGGTLDATNGGLTNGGTVNANGGAFMGAITNTGTFNVLGTVTGNSTFDNNGTAQLLVTGGDFTGLTTLTNASTNATGIQTTAGNTLSANSVVNNAGSTINNAGTLSSLTTALSNAGTLTTTGTVNGGLTNTGTVSASGAVNGAIANNGAGTFTVTGNLVGNNTFDNNGTAQLLVTGGDFTGLTTLTNASTNATGIQITAGNTLAANSIVNNAGSSINNAGTLSSLTTALSNAGTLTTTGTVNGGLTNTGTVSASGAVNGAIVNNGAGTFTVTGNLVGNNTFDNNGTAQLLVTGGNFTGITTLTNNSTNATGIQITAGNTLSADSVVNVAGATISNAGTLSSLNTALSNAGTLTTTGTVNGGLTNTGTVSASGAVNGAIANNGAGTFTVTGNLVGNNTFDNNGTAQLLVTGGDFTGLTTLTNASTNATGIQITAGNTLAANSIVNNAGATLLNNGSVNAALSNAGTVDNNGGWTGNVTSNSGTINNNAGATWLGATASSGTINNSGTWTTTGPTGFVTSGILNLNAGSTLNMQQSGLTNDAGTVNAFDTAAINGNNATNGFITNNNGALFTVQSGTVTQVGGAFLNSVNSTFNVTGGNYTATTTDMTNTTGATLNVAAGKTLMLASLRNGATITGGATVMNAGTITTTGQVSNVGATGFTNTFTSTGTVDTGNGGYLNTGAGAITNVEGTLIGGAGHIGNMAGGTFNVTGDLNIGSIVDNGAGSTFNARGVTITDISGTPFIFNNAGTLSLLNPPSPNGTTNFIGVAGSTLNNQATGVIQMQNGSVLDRLQLNPGNLAPPATSPLYNTSGVAFNYVGTAGSQINVDVNLNQNTTNQRADLLNVSGGLSGATTVNFNSIAGAGYFATPIPVVMSTTQTAGTTFAAAGLPTTNGVGVDYSFVNLTGAGSCSGAANCWAVVASLNSLSTQALTQSVAGLTSSLAAIETGFHQSASALVASAESQLPNKVSSGLWVRANYGESTVGSTGTLTNSFTGSVTATSHMHSRYGGFQVGADSGLLNIQGTGWNGHIGLTGGEVKAKNSEQDAVGSVDLSIPFFGVYGAFRNGPWFGDITVRHDWYSVTATNNVLFSAPTDFKGHGTSVNTSFGYHFALANNWFVEPQVGFTWLRANFDNLTLTAASFTSGSATVALGNIDSKVGRATVRAGTTVTAGNFALQPFVTASVLREFANDATSHFLSGTTDAPISTTRVGTFGQFGFGVSAQPIGTNLVTFVRGDIRTGQHITGVSITGGARYTFN